MGNDSIVLPGEVAERFLVTLERFSGLRAMRAMARLPCLGWERMRAMPVPWKWLGFVLCF